VPSDEVADYTLVVSRSAARAIAEELPEAVAAAVIELITGPLIEDPYRVGHRLRGPLQGRWSARRGTYRVIYEVDESAQEVTVLDVSHRSEAYGRRAQHRPRPSQG
jgi:mRNA interferase RelE/StbE